MHPIFRILPLSALVLTGCGTFSGYPELKNYQGDGAAKDLSFRSYGKRIYSYEVRFPKFDLTKPFSAEYAVGELPQLPGARPILYFVLARSPAAGASDSQFFLDTSDPQRREKNFGDATVSMEIRDSHGNTTIQYSHKLTELMWTIPFPAKNEVGGWPREFIQTQGLILQPGEHYTLIVRYSPGSTTLTGQAYLMLNHGGI